MVLDETMKLRGEAGDSGLGDWGLGIGDWGLGIGDWGLELILKLDKTNLIQYLSAGKNNEMEGILLIGLISVGGLGLLSALAFLFHGFINKRSENVKTGSLLLILPGLCAAIIFWWYGAIVPEGKQQTRMQLSGTYVAVIHEDGADTVEMVNDCYKLILFPDGCFKLDDTPGLSYSGPGTWEAEWIDGQFVLYSPEKTIIATGMPSDYEITINNVTFHKSAPCE